MGLIIILETVSYIGITIILTEIMFSRPLSGIRINER